MGPASSEILTVLGIIIFILLCAAAFLLYAFITKENTINEMKAAHQKLMRSFDDLDEQAKLIVRTDLELNKTHEEMDKRLNGLNALQRTSRQMSQALNENEIFQRVSPSRFEDLGFARILIASTNDHNILKARLNVGYKDTRAEAILKEISAEESIIKTIHSLSSINCPNKIKERITQIFE